MGCTLTLDIDHDLLYSRSVKRNHMKNHQHITKSIMSINAQVIWYANKQGQP